MFLKIVIALENVPVLSIRKFPQLVSYIQRQMTRITLLVAAMVHKLKLFEEVKMGAKEREENLQKESHVLCVGFHPWSNEKAIVVQQYSLWGRILGANLDCPVHEMHDSYVNHMNHRPHS